MGFNKDKKQIDFNDIKDDPIKFTELFRIGFNSATKLEGILPLLAFEEDVLKLIHKNKYSLIIKSRQMHASSLIASYTTFKLTTTENYQVAVISPNIGYGVDFKEKVYNNVLEVPFEFFNKGKKFLMNKKIMQISNGSKLHIFGSSKDSLISRRFDLIIFEEADFINNFEKIYQTAITQLNKNGKIIIVSTPNYEGGFFEKLYKDSKNSKNNFQSLELHWTINPYYHTYIEKIGDNANHYLNYSSPYIENIKKTFLGDIELFNAEYNLVFRKRPQKKEKTFTFRLNTDLTVALLNRINNQKFQNNISNYIRYLIQKDIKKSTE